MGITNEGAVSTSTTSKFYRPCHVCLMETATKRRVRAPFGASDRAERNLLARCRSACGGQKRKVLATRTCDSGPKKEAGSLDPASLQ